MYGHKEGQIQEFTKGGPNIGWKVERGVWGPPVKTLKKTKRRIDYNYWLKTFSLGQKRGVRTPCPPAPWIRH